ncbi:hypothetical protein NECAME_10012 [Necator americanus]|uniref:Uncharacterized protein n=1 Tax=Necator americanus TaxID=51031 RepID=W2TDM3_NECAM|nr:hypothetical protein NECAME_10012 [Necator americanus]ETN79122.1 hypothetical protein NECAME_10012 [Necator americanus]
MSGNWMWAAKCEGEGVRLVEACDALCKALADVGCAIDGGKDSLSMAAKVDNELVKAPGTLVLSAYAPCPDVMKTVTPNFKGPRMHDVSDGGFIVALLEMAFAGNVGIRADIRCETDPITFLFAEEAGVFLEVEHEHSAAVMNEFRGHSMVVGEVFSTYGPGANIEIRVNGGCVVNESLVTLREVWEETSHRLGLMQTDAACLQEAKQVRSTTELIAYIAPFEWGPVLVSNSAHYITSAPRVAIIREEGSNGDREMAAAFAIAGFQPHDVTMTDLLGGHTLEQYRVVAFVGGFSYADVLGSAKGWAAAIRYNPVVRLEFLRFQHRRDTLSFGVCNGCQLMAHLGWIGEYEGAPSVFLAENRCGRFESSFGPVRIEQSPSIWLRGMEGAVLGLWSSHGEGRFTYRSSNVLSALRKSHQIAVRYVDSEGQPSMKYPWNPNGSEDSVAAICSEDGRHLAMMPHSDRSFLSWQWPDYPRDWVSEDCAAPWLKMFQNAYSWIQEN